MKRIAVIGDIILDKYDYCINRENPESSAPCYTVEKTIYKPGGAGNAAANLKTLGSKVTLFGCMGEDESAQNLKKALSEFEIQTELVSESHRPTILKERVLSFTDGRYHFRKDTEVKGYLSEEKTAELLEKIKLEKDISLIIVSDYNKGVISKQLMDGIKKMGVEIIVDPKPAHKELYKNVFLVTPNIKEARELSGNKNELLGAVSLMTEFNSNILLKRGKDGMSYFGVDDKRFDLPAEARKVVDVTGAGDTVVATFAHFYNKGYSIEDSIKLSNKAAGIAVAYPGCYQVKEKELL